MSVHYFRVSYDTVKREVESETVQLAKRRPRMSGDGKSVEGDMVDDMVLSEADEHVIRRYFDQAASNIVLNMPSTYIIGTPTGQPWADMIVSDRDLNLFLRLNQHWPDGYKGAVEDMMKSYVVDYIVGTWFTAKSNDDAKVYLQRLQQKLFDIKRLICRTARPLRRRPSDI